MDTIKTDRLNVPDATKLKESRTFDVVNGVIIALTQGYCHNGHPLIQDVNPAFLGFPGIAMEVSCGDHVEVVIVSPVHGHHARIGGSGFADGDCCGLACPRCHEQLAAFEEPCSCGKGALRLIHLTPALEAGDHALVCDVWGCHRSRVVDRWELLSEFVDD